MPKTTNPSSSPPSNRTPKIAKKRDTTANRPQCHNFANKGTCPFGDRCRFSHVTPATASQTSSSTNPPEKRYCYTYFNTGACPYGDECRYPHIPKLSEQPSAIPNTSEKRYCYTFYNTGACPHADNCQYPHIPKSTAKPSSSSQSSKTRPCYTFLKTGTCRFGDDCHYSHVAEIVPENPSSSSQTTSKSPCFTFQTTGTCRYGDKCRYSHLAKPKLPPSSTTSDPQASQHVIDFTTKLSRDVRRPNFTLPFDDPFTLVLWQNAWAAVAVGANPTAASTLIRAYMRLPATSAITPQTQHLLTTLSIVTAHSAQDHSTPKTIISTLQLVASAIEHRLIPKHTSVSDYLLSDCNATVKRLTTSARTALLKAIADPAYSENASGLLHRFLDLLKRYSRLLGPLAVNDDIQEQQTSRPPWAGWQEATVGWLLRGTWLDAPQLQNSYEDVASYAENLRKIVTMLTFYWGAGAIFPKCRKLGHDDRPCDQPLCAACKNDRRPPCSRKLPGGNLCSAPAKWRCSRKGHDAVCGGCLRDLQTTIIGKPGPRASTDIYDAVVERETVRREGVVYILSQLESRKPPRISPNWKTTYRLQCSGLVGVVRLSASCEPLEPQKHLELAEIVPVNSSEGILTDFQQRQQGRLALRLLTKGDLSRLSDRMETLENGTRVALIDMQVFVPEVLSVLSTISDDEFVDHLNAIPFSDAMICQKEPRSLLAKDRSIEEAVVQALSDTEIEVIRRLPPRVQSSLSANLVNLVRSSSLDGTQLKAFLAAIQTSLHCTQGPPGTGKSYLGVTLIRALAMIRDCLARCGVSVGPIVVLAYKNHALDEILLDVIKSDSQQQWSFGRLIRCGKSDDERLNEYRERNSPAERAAEQVLATRVACMRSMRRTLRDWRSLRISLLMSVDKHGADHPLLEWMPSRHGAENNRFGAPCKYLLHAVQAQVLVGEFSEDPSSEAAYRAVESLSRNWDVGKQEDLISRSSLLDGLEADTEHWNHDGPHRMLFLVQKWLASASPPPRCLASMEGGCLMQSPAPGAYCVELHACKYEFGCDRRRGDGVQFCKVHICTHRDNSHQECSRQRIPRSDVCKCHACPRCVILDSPRIHAKEPGVGGCSQHTCNSRFCGEIQVSVHLPYCARHCCRLCLEAANENQESKIKSAERCGRSAFCNEHKCVIPNCIKNRLPDEGIPQDLCVSHACIACNGKRNQVSKNCARSRLCDMHMCSHMLDQKTPCVRLRRKDSRFCEAHTCYICCREGLPLTRTVGDRPPRNVCVIHPLCAFLSTDGDQCNEATHDENEQYCRLHVKEEVRNSTSATEDVVQMQCCGINRKGKNCKSSGPAPKGSKLYYCPAHLSQKPDSSSDSEDDLMDNESSSEEEGVQVRLHDIDDGASAVAFPIATRKGETRYISCAIEATECSKAGQDLPYRNQNLNEVENETRRLDSGSIISPDSVHNTLQVANETQNLSHVSFDEIDPDSNHNSQARDSDQSSEPSLDDNQPYDSSLTECKTDLEYCSERLMYNTNPDECEMQFSAEELSDSEVPDHVQRLHEINDNDSVSASESDDDSVYQAGNHDSAARSTEYSSNPNEWTWNQSASERYHRAAEFLRCICNVVTRIVTIAESHVERARHERSEAAGFVFKNARLVGATVVGATRRLQAIRASEPFAMLVEEACEVLEPTLVSVLAVRSLCKLELIGDHRQLPAFVQPCWFPIQATHPTITVSLFERLVNSISSIDKDESSSVCSVLDVQRRMRPEICDLTRCEYDDVVNIVDHPCTMSRKIGDAHKIKGLALEHELWCGQGIVPGLQSSVFFWNMTTPEGKAAVGLSRCNVGEAEACVNLIEWLLHCGIPPTSISVITPYKGQKLTIVKALRRVDGAFPGRGKGRFDAHTKGVNISTVDRYQGDENDIVILSLVCTNPGNRFIALRNRFIVASSRARLGFYIIGSTDALISNVHRGHGPSHWRRLLQDLTQSENSTTDELDDLGVTKGRRVSRKLSICCPRHQETVTWISKHTEFPHLSQEALNAFCSKPCPFVLPWCGHGCNVPCHSPRRVPHTSKCDKTVQRPCDSHEDVPLRCEDVAKAFSRSTASLAEALRGYECEIMMEWERLDCSHTISVRCHDFKRLQKKDFKLPLCKEKVADYVHPSCGHIFSSPYCHSRRKWEDKPPRCEEVISHRRPCGCSTRITCQQSVREASLDTPTRCLEAVSRPRPRCTHLWSSRCHEATAVRELWLEERGESITTTPPLVVHGTCYGPSETELSVRYPDLLLRRIPQCHVQTEYRSSCGHTITTSCSEAFELASGSRKESLCASEGNFESPICGHQIRAQCFFRLLVSGAHSSLWVANLNGEHGNSERIIDERALQNVPKLDQRLKKIRNACSDSVGAARTCGHVTESLSCAGLFTIINSRKLPPCKAQVDFERSCGHLFKTVCSRRTNPLPACNEAVHEVFAYSCGRPGHEVRPNTCHELTKLRTSLGLRCPIEVPCIRARCKHHVRVPCYLERNVILVSPGNRLGSSECAVVEAGVEYCSAAASVADCLEPVVYRRFCGHEEVDVQCHLAFEWASSERDAPPCKHVVEAPSPLCNHPLKILCQHEHRLQNINLWENMTRERITTEINGETVTIPVVDERKHAPLQPPHHVMSLLRCGLRTRLVRSCGHEEEIPCEKVFEKLSSECGYVESEKCSECGYEVEVACSKLRKTEEPVLCQNLVKKICSTCGKNTAQVECYRQRVECNREVKDNLPCGHVVTWICGEDEPITDLDASKCLRCLKREWTDALSEARRLAEAKDPITTEDRPTDDKDDPATFNARFASLLQQFRDQVADTLPSSCILSLSNLSFGRIKNLLSAYQDILSCNIDVISASIENDCNDNMEFSSPPDIFDARQSFDIVYCIVARDANPEDYFIPTETRYGRGTRASILSMKALEGDCDEQGSDGSLTICVAGALKYRMLADKPPFRTREGYRKTHGKKAIKAEIKARKLMQKYKHAGFDHVSDMDGTNGYARVYWIPGGIVPVLKLDLQLFQQCGICLDDMVPSKGWFCPAKHFVCRDCFNRIVILAQQPDGNSTLTVDRNGYLLCPQDGCGAKYEEVMLLGQAHDASADEMKKLFEGLQQLKMDAHAKHEVDTALEGQRARLQAEFQRIMEIKDLDQRQAETLRLKIIDEVLTLRCPVCNMAFIDFEGCFALNCSNCKVKFCAWCINHHTKGDVHGHVASCPKRSGEGLFHRQEVFERHHRGRRKKRVIEILKRENADVRKRVLQRLDGDLRDLGIEIRESEFNGGFRRGFFI